MSDSEDNIYYKKRVKILESENEELKRQIKKLKKENEMLKPPCTCEGDLCALALCALQSA